MDVQQDKYNQLKENGEKLIYLIQELITIKDKYKNKLDDLTIEFPIRTELLQIFYDTILLHTNELKEIIHDLNKINNDSNNEWSHFEEIYNEVSRDIP